MRGGRERGRTSAAFRLREKQYEKQGLFATQQSGGVNANPQPLNAPLLKDGIRWCAAIAVQ